VQGFFCFGLGQPSGWRRWLHVDPLMGSRGIEVNPPLLNKYLGFTEAVEQLAIEPLIPEFAVKALAVADVYPKFTTQNVFF
jgi:hypothetical protein